jgi:hypothetical protein
MAASAHGLHLSLPLVRRATLQVIQIFLMMWHGLTMIPLPEPSSTRIMALFLPPSLPPLSGIFTALRPQQLSFTLTFFKPPSQPTLLAASTSHCGTTHLLLVPPLPVATSSRRCLRRLLRRRCQRQLLAAALQPASRPSSQSPRCQPSWLAVLSVRTRGRAQTASCAASTMGLALSVAAPAAASAAPGWSFWSHALRSAWLLRETCIRCVALSFSFKTEWSDRPQRPGLEIQKARRVNN